GAAGEREPGASVFAQDLVLEDHRPLGWGTVHSRDEVVTYVRGLLELRPDTRFRTEHVLALEDRRSLMVSRWVRNESEGAFEIPFVAVGVVNPDGRTQRVHIYALEQLDAARACYEKLAPTAPSPGVENAAARSVDRFSNAWAARDWEGIAALFAPGFRAIDHRSYAHLDLDRDQHLASLRFRFEMRSSRTTAALLATRGHRLGLVRQRFELADGDVGPSEAESLGGWGR